MKKYLTALLALSLAACTNDPGTETDPPQGCDTECEVIIGDYSDMSGYEKLDREGIFIDTDVQEMIRDMDNGQTFVVYFGFVRCPWCQEAVPELAQTAEEAGMKVGYVNTRSSEEIHSNIEIPDYDLLTERAGTYFPIDDEGIPHLYTPFVFFIKNGEIVMTHQGTVDGHDAHEREMTEEETEELRKIYTEGFGLLK